MTTAQTRLIVVALVFSTLGFAVSRLTTTTTAPGACISSADLRSELRSLLADTQQGRSPAATPALPRTDAASQPAAALASPAGPGAPQEAVLSGNADALVDGQNLVASAERSGSWGRDEVQGFRHLAVSLTPQQRHELLQQVIMSVNLGKIRLHGGLL